MGHKKEWFKLKRSNRNQNLKAEKTYAIEGTNAKVENASPNVSTSMNCLLNSCLYPNSVRRAISFVWISSVFFLLFIDMVILTRLESSSLKGDDGKSRQLLTCDRRSN